MTETTCATRCSLVIAVLLFSAVARAEPSHEGLLVETGSPDALCPDLVATREAIHSRLGTLALEGEQQGWLARYTVGHAPGSAGDFVRLELFDSSGVRRLMRDLPRADESCATLSQAIALVVERYFRELAPAPVGAAVPPSAPEPSAAPAPAPVVAPMPAPAQRTPRLALGLAVGFAGAQPSAIAGVYAGYWLMPNAHLELSLFADLEARREPLGAAQVELRSYPAQLGLGFGPRFQAWEAFAGPELRLSLERVSGTGLQSFDPGPGAELAVGVGAGMGWWPARQLGLNLRTALDYRLTGTKFRVETAAGPQQAVLDSAAFQALVSFGVAWGYAQ